MTSTYQLDFDQVAQVGRKTRHRATFPAKQFEYATDPEAKSSYIVQSNVRNHHGEWFLPLYEAHVRAWLKTLLFTRPPIVSAGGVEITCSQEVHSEEVANWLAHYSSGFFTIPALEQELHELEQGIRQFSYGKEHEHAPRLAALRQLLRKELPDD